MSEALRTLHITRSIDPIGGCEIYVRNLIDELVGRKMEPSICTAIPPADEVSERLCVPIHTISNLSCLTHAGARDSVNFLSLILDKIRPDLIHIHDLNNPYVLEFCGLHYPTLKTTLNADSYCGGVDKYLYRSKRACPFRLGFGCLAVAYYEQCMSRHPKRSFEIVSIKKRALAALRWVSRLIVPSLASKEILSKNGVPFDKITVLPLFSNFCQRVQRQSYPSGDKPKVLFLGRLRAYKGVAYLLRALRLVKTDYEALIVGEGEDKNGLIRLAEELGISKSVRFTGNIEHDQIEKLILKAALVVVPSIYPDSFPTVGLEAMALARPVVGFAIGGIPEWLDHEKTGLLVKTQDVPELARAVDYLLRNPAIASQMGAAGRQKYDEQFTPDVHMAKLLRIYREAMDTFSSKPT